MTGRAWQSSNSFELRLPVRVPLHPAKSQLELSTVFHALSDPVRLQMVLRLRADGELASGSFGDLGLAKSTLSHHLKVLREAGVTLTRIQGTQYLVSVRESDLEARFPGLIGLLAAQSKGRG